jgi:polar amino acid transport system substrate-binding protein
VRPLLSLFLLFLFSLGGCSTSTPRQTYSIGIDASFFPLQLKEGRGDLLGFLSELLEEMGKRQGVRFVRVLMSWDNLLEGLKQERYQGAFSVAAPSVVNKTKYAFSDPLFFTGPILITRTQNPKVTLADLQGKAIALEKNEASIELLSRYPSILPEFYDSIPEALEGTASGKYAACLVPVLEGAAYVHNLYHGRLAISSPVLTSDALRLLTLSGTNLAVLTLFNEGLAQLKSSGTFEELLTKWSLPKEALAH